MRLVYSKGKLAITASLFSVLVLIAGIAHSATPATLEPALQEVVLKVENMT